MAFMIFAASFTVATTVFAMFSERAARKGKLPLWLAYLFALAAIIAWLNFFAALMEAFG